MADDGELWQEMASQSCSSDCDADAIYSKVFWGYSAEMSDLDMFYSNLYDYYRKQGLKCMITEVIIDLFVLAFTALFSTFLFLYFDWAKLLECDNATNCNNLTEYVRKPVLRSAWGAIVSTYFVALCIFWLWKLFHFIKTIQSVFHIHQFVQNALNISSDSLESIKWDNVVRRLIALQENDETKVDWTGHRVDANTIASRIMRKDNYIIAIFEHNKLDFLTGFKQFDNLAFSSHMLWILRNSLTNTMFDKKFRLRENFTAKELGRILRTMAILHFFCTPFALLFMLIHCVLRNAQLFHTSKEHLSHRDWTAIAQWRFREYNELQHVFDRRINLSHKPANAYIQQFQNKFIILLAQGVCFVAGSFLSLYLMFGILDENIPLYVELFGRNLLWHIAVLSGIITVCRLVIPERKGTAFEPEKHMANVTELTHYQIVENCRNYSELCRFSNMYPYRLVTLVFELCSVLCAPYFLWVVYPRNIPAIVEFIKLNTITVEGLGDVYKDSVFAIDDNHVRSDKHNKSLKFFEKEHMSWTTESKLQCT